MRRVWLSLLLVAGPACQAQESFQLTVAPGAVTAIAIVEDLEQDPSALEAHFLRLVAQDVTNELELELPRLTARGDQVRVTVLSYDRSFAELGIEGGELEIVGPDTPRRKLPRATEIRSALLADGALTSLDALPAPLDALRIKVPGVCKKLRVEQVEVEGSAGEVHTMVTTGDEVIMLIGTDAPMELPAVLEWFAFDAAGVRRSVIDPIWFPTAAMDGRDGRLYLNYGSALTTLSRGSDDRYHQDESFVLPGTAFQNVRAAFVSELDGLDGPIASREVFALTSTGAILRLTDRLEVIDDQAVNVLGERGAILRLGPNHVLRSKGGDIIEYLPNGRSELHEPMLPGEAFFTELEVIPGIGIVGAGTVSADGALAVKHEGRDEWEPFEIEAAGFLLADSPFDELIAFAGGFIVAGDKAHALYVDAYEWDEHDAVTSWGVCEEILGPGDYTFAAKLDERTAFIGGLQKFVEDRRPARVTKVTWLDD